MVDVDGQPAATATLSSTTLSTPSTPTESSEQWRPPTLAELSRNASVISSSSESELASPVDPPSRPKPLRLGPNASTSTSTSTTNSSTNTTRPVSPSSHNQHPNGPPTPRAARPPVHLGFHNANEDGGGPSTQPNSPQRSRAPSRQRAQGRSASQNGRGVGVSYADFAFGDILGEGSYSTVHQATHRASGQVYAIKVLDKAHLKRNNKLQVALAEKNVLVRLGAGNPGIVRLHWAFQDEWSLYFVLDLASNGELQTLISRLGSLSLPCVQYWGAQIVDALAYMHGKGVIHRDLKPENILLDSEWRVKLTDFGTGKILAPGEVPARTFVGTAQYVAPELLERSETSAASDLWAFGCVVFQAVAGTFTFAGLSEYLTWQKIKALEYTLPEGFDPAAGELVASVLVRDPEARLGAGQSGSKNDMAALRKHRFFEGLNWSTLWTDEHPPIEAGLVKKEPRTPGAEYIPNHDFAWDDDEDDDDWEQGQDDDEEDDEVRLRRSAGALVGNTLRRPDDEMEWAEGPSWALGGRKAEQGVGEVGYGYDGGGMKDTSEEHRPVDEGGNASPADKGGTSTSTSAGGTTGPTGSPVTGSPSMTYLQPSQHPQRPPFETNWSFPNKTPSRRESDVGGAGLQPFRFPRIEESAVDDEDAEPSGGLPMNLGLGFDAGVEEADGAHEGLPVGLFEPLRSPAGDGLGPLPSEAQAISINTNTGLPVPKSSNARGSFSTASATSSSSSDHGNHHDPAHATGHANGNGHGNGNGIGHGPPASLVSGSPVERLGARLMAFGMQARRVTGNTKHKEKEREKEEREREREREEPRRGRSPGPAPESTASAFTSQQAVAVDPAEAATAASPPRPLSGSNSNSSDDPHVEGVEARGSQEGPSLSPPNPRTRTMSGAEKAMADSVATMLQFSERVLCRAPVGAGGLRRRASVMLLAPTHKGKGKGPSSGTGAGGLGMGSESGVKPRTLVLTDRRVLVLKAYEGIRASRRDGKGKGGAVGIKAEMALAGSVLARERGKTVVSAVESRGDAGFVLITNEKPAVFVAASPENAKEWVTKISAELERLKAAASGKT